MVKKFLFVIILIPTILLNGQDSTYRPGQVFTASATLSATCVVGAITIKTGTNPGIYICSATNIWTSSNSIDATYYGCKGDGTTDNSACITTALTALTTAGGGTLSFPSGTFRVNSQILIPNDAATPQPNQVNIRFTGAGGGSAWYGTTSSILDLRYTAIDGNAKIETRGKGVLAIDNLTLKDGGSSNATPFIHSTNTVIIVDNNSFIGAGNVGQDAIVLGGISPDLSGNLDAPFQGYGTKITNNHFRLLNRGLYGLTYVNNVFFSQNTFQGNVGTIAVELNGTVAPAASGIGNIFINNLFEMDVYVNAFKFTHAQANSLIGNGMWDSGANVTGYYNFIETSTQNIIICGWNPANKPTLIGDDVAFSNNTILCGQFGLLDPTGRGFAASQLAFGAIINGIYDTTKDYSGQLNIVSRTSNTQHLRLGYDSAVGKGIIDAYNAGVAANILSLNPSGGGIEIGSLKTTGAATGKKVVCVDTTTGQLYASSSGTECLN